MWRVAEIKKEKSKQIQTKKNKERKMQIGNIKKMQIGKEEVHCAVGGVVEGSGNQKEIKKKIKANPHQKRKEKRCK